MNCEILGHKKKDCRNSPFHVYHLSNKLLPFFSYINTKTPYTITETLILSRKLPAGFRDNTGSFRVCIWVLPDSIRVSVIITDFCLRVYTIRQKNPRTTVRALVNVKMPLKAHENNVNFKAM